MLGDSLQPSTLARERLRNDIRHLALWTFQGWLAMAFIGAGYAKTSESLTTLQGLLSWFRPELEALTRALGLVEICLGLAMLVPLLSWKIGRPILLAGAVGVIALSMLMVVVHGRKAEVEAVLLNVALVMLGVAVLIGRRPGTPSPLR